MPQTHLVLHQGDQRGDDEHKSVLQEGWHDEAHGLATTCAMHPNIPMSDWMSMSDKCVSSVPHGPQGCDLNRDLSAGCMVPTRV